MFTRFKKILSRPKKTVPAIFSDRRKFLRLPIENPLDFKAIIELHAHDDNGRINPDGAGQSWTGYIMNLSKEGLCMKIHPAAFTLTNEKCKVTLLLNNQVTVIPATVAHFRNDREAAICGVSLEFTDPETKAVYLQIIKPLKIGASFKACEPAWPMPALLNETYAGDFGSRLNIWRLPEAGVVSRFDFRINNHGVHGIMEHKKIEVYPLNHALSDEDKHEILWIFRLAMKNLAQGIPFDVRQSLQDFVS
jgi:hypothetical protein